MNTKIIAGFPGIGKTYLYNLIQKDTTKRFSAIDSDSSTFDKKDFPKNYMEHILGNVGKVDLIFISSHKEIRDALTASGIPYNLIFPKKTLKKTYLRRFRKRGDDQKFINLIDKNWVSWIKECNEQTGCTKIELQKGQYLYDILKNK